MTHFDRCAHGRVLLTKGQMQAKEHIIWIVCLFVCLQYIWEQLQYILCVCKCVQAHFPACSVWSEGLAYKRKSKKSRSHALTQQNTKQQQATQAWLVGSPRCSLQCAPGLTHPTICKLLLQASGFKGEAPSIMSWSHRPWRPWVLYASAQYTYTRIHINVCMCALRSWNLPVT